MIYRQNIVLKRFNSIAQQVRTEEMCKNLLRMFFGTIIRRLKKGPSSHGGALKRAQCGGCHQFQLWYASPTLSLPKTKN